MAHATILITGASDGIGAASARTLMAKGHRVIIVGRSAAKTAAVAKHTGAESFVADFSRLDDVRALAEQIKASLDGRLDVLANNAGGIFGDRIVTTDGYEYTFQVNHLAPFLLTHLLLPLLRRSREPRIVTVSSEAHRFARLDFNDLQSEKRYAPLVAYADSKLANILFTRSLANQLRGEGITANCLHPGGVATNFGSGFGGGLLGLAMTLARPFFISPEKGAETSIFLASSPAVKGVSGQYFDRKKPKEPSQKALSHYNAQRLWEISEQLTRTRERMTND